jgi:hypothetical protein
MLDRVEARDRAVLNQLGLHIGVDFLEYVDMAAEVE